MLGICLVALLPSEEKKKNQSFCLFFFVTTAQIKNN